MSEDNPEKRAFQKSNPELKVQTQASVADSS